MGDAVIYAWREEQGDVWTGEWALDRKDKWVPAEANKYILATPEALTASPEVQKLVAEAEARGMERAAARARVYASSYAQSSDGRNTFILLAEWADAEAAAIRSEATK